MAIKDILVQSVNYGEVVSYESSFDFDKFEIKDFDKTNLLEKEQIIIKSQKHVIKNLYDIAKNLYDSQQILANYHSGSFIEWFTNLGLKKDYVYRMIDKYKLVLETNVRSAIDLPVRIVQDIKKLNINTNQKIEILKSEDPKNKIKEISLCAKSDFSELEMLTQQLQYHMKKVKEIKAKIALLNK